MRWLLDNRERLPNALDTSTMRNFGKFLSHRLFATLSVALGRSWEGRVEHVAVLPRKDLVDCVSRQPVAYGRPENVQS